MNSSTTLKALANKSQITKRNLDQHVKHDFYGIRVIELYDQSLGS